MRQYILQLSKVAASLILVLIGSSVSAQQEAQFSQYMNNNVLINPGVTGMEQYLNVNLGYRNQWNGLDGAINTYYISAHQRLGNNSNTVNHSLPVRGANPQLQVETSNSFAGGISPHGVGGYFFHDDQGISTQSGLGLNYAYHLSLGGNNISFGVTGGIIQYALDGDELNPLDPSDNSVIAGKSSAITGDFSVGAWLSSKNYYVGLALNQFLQSKVNLQSGVSSFNKQHNHYNITAGYKVDLGGSFILLPSVLVKYVNPAPATFDLNTVVSMKNKYSFGFSYRNSDAVVILAGVRINNIQFGYSYDVNTSKLSSYNNGTHELMLGMGLGAGANNGKTLHW